MKLEINIPDEDIPVWDAINARSNAGQENLPTVEEYIQSALEGFAAGEVKAEVASGKFKTINRLTEKAAAGEISVEDMAALEVVAEKLG